MSEVKQRREGGAQSIVRALSILDLFRASSAPIPLKVISTSTNLTMSTAHRITKALQAHGYLIQDGDGRYSLGPAVVELARVVLERADHNELIAAAMPHLERLRRISGETVGLHVRLGDQRLCIAELQSPHPMRMATGVGGIYPLAAGASGKALLSTSPEDEIRRLWTDRGLDRTADTEGLAAFVEELRRVRAIGVAVSFGETVAGASAMAAPIENSSGEALAAVNITGPAERWGTAQMQAVVPDLLDVRHTLEEKMGNRHHRPLNAVDLLAYGPTGPQM